MVSSSPVASARTLPVSPSQFATPPSLAYLFHFLETVLVVEYGYFDDNPAQLDPSSSSNYPPKDLFNVTTVPQRGIGGRLGTVYAAAVVGGGSTVNGMLFDRGSADDYDNWEKLGNPGWGFNSLFPYFKKVGFTEP